MNALIPFTIKFNNGTTQILNRSNRVQAITDAKEFARENNINPKIAYVRSNQNLILNI